MKTIPITLLDFLLSVFLEFFFTRFMLSLEISFSPTTRKRKDSISTGDFKKLLRNARQKKISGFPSEDAQVALIFLNDQEIQKLNKQYRKKNTPTDVLSFELFEKDFSAPIKLLGEIYISLPTARRQALEHRHSFQKELNILFVHGLLHLLGYDHETNKDLYQMQALEKKILE